MVSENAKDRFRKSLEKMMEKKREENREEQYDAGHRRGRIWAEMAGEADGLTRLAELRGELDDQRWHGYFEPQKFAVYSPGQTLAMVLNRNWEEVGDWSLAAEWWRDTNDANENEDAYEPIYIQGFAEGALAVWEEAMSEDAT